MNDLKTITVNYKEIVISDKYRSKYQVSVFDTERQKTTYRNYFKTLPEAEECFNELVEIQEQKMCYQF
jgi:predicted choloylglycine hydrolase